MVVDVALTTVARQGGDRLLPQVVEVSEGGSPLKVLDSGRAGSTSHTLAVVDVAAGAAAPATTLTYAALARSDAGGADLRLTGRASVTP